MNNNNINNNKFVISASEAETMTKSLNLPSVLHLLPYLVPSAQSLSRPPISNYQVSAVGLGSDNRIFIGVNLEFLKLPLHHSVHAEQFLLTNLSINSSPRLVALAVSAAPCGHCRQFLQELRLSSSLQILVLDDHDQNQNHDHHHYQSLSDFLPNPFGPHDLLHQDTPLLLDKHYNHLEFVLPTLQNMNGEKKHEESEMVLKEAALEAANGAHAPYSGCASGVALMDCDGNVFKGSYVESAAYNPSFGPVQAALVAYVASGGGEYGRIVSAALVEMDEAKVKQEDTARLLLKAVAPKCELKVFHCRSSKCT